LGLSGRLDAGEERERAVLELHEGAVERRQRGGDFEEAERDGLVGAEHVARGDAEDQGVADLASGPGDGDLDGFLHGAQLPI